MQRVTKPKLVQESSNIATNFNFRQSINNFVVFTIFFNNNLKIKPFLNLKINTKLFSAMPISVKLLKFYSYSTANFFTFEN